MNLKKLLFVNLLVSLLFASVWDAFGSSYDLTDPYSSEFIIASPSRDTIPLNDRDGDFINNPNRNPFDLNDPSIITQEVEYDPVTGQYIIIEKIGEDYYRNPTYMTFDEYLDWRAKEQEQEYFDRLTGTGDERSESGVVDPLAKFDIKNNLIDRLFGGTTVDIRPQGNIDLTFGWRYSRQDNPGLTLRQQRTNNFDFDMNINMSVEGKIGEKLKLNFNYNSKPTFDFDNQMKIHYDPTQFSEDDIIQNIEAGNVSLPLRGSLIQGAQSLFGVRVDTKWGPLTLSTLVSQQKSDREVLQVQGGSQFQEFEVYADQYDENRHFFLSHYNRATFDEALNDLPVVRSVFQLEKVQVFLTDDRNVNREEVVNIVAFTDLGEPTRITNTDVVMPTNPDLDHMGRALPANNANNLYALISRDTAVREIQNVSTRLSNPPYNLQQSRDFEKVSAQILQEGQHYTVNKDLGFISLNVNVQPDQVVGVSYQYSYNGEVYQVGEFANDIPSVELREDTLTTDSLTRTQTVVFTKMLKSATQRVDLPMWDLMMKNVYNIGAYNVNREDFQLGIYYEEPGGGEKQFLPESSGLGNVPLLRLFNLDNLNVQLDPFPDGVFDFVPNLTIYPRNGRIMFPVLEPFGSDLVEEFPDTALATRIYSYQVLYDSTVTRAREYPDKNRFVLKGSYKSSVSNEISLNAFSIPEGSIRVTAGGQVLQEGRDYTVDYNIGKVTILNDAYITSGVPIQVSFEDNSLFGFQQKNLIGIRADYDVNKNLKVGGTYMHLFERPYTQKVNIGDDPINNKVFGLDFTWGRESNWITKMVDAIPFIETKEPSNINITAEAAAIQPGHSRAINEAEDGSQGGNVYIDDFEGSVSGFTIINPLADWALASVPQSDQQGNNRLFPEADQPGILSGVNRARLSWYLLEQRVRSAESGTNPYTLEVDIREIFQNADRQTFNNYIRPLDLTFFPSERGPYNFDLPGGTPFSAGLNFEGMLNTPESRWGGMMRSLPNNDFEAANIEFIEFWLLSPFLNDNMEEVEQPLDPFIAEGREGELYINLGNVSEDILKDGQIFFENGLPGAEGSSEQSRQTYPSPWGRVPAGPYITNAFDNQEDSRRAQDVGLDGLDDAMERDRFSDYLSQISPPQVSQQVANEFAADPSNDNFQFYLDPDIPNGTPARERYKRFNNPQGNSKPNEGNTFVESAKLTPDTEDLNDDKTLNESETYFQYKIPIRWDGNRGIDIEENEFITDVVEADNGRLWYRFKVPIEKYETVVGGIQDFRSIRFMRMYLRGFEQPVTLRFATLELGRNQWRRYKRPIIDDGPNLPDLPSLSTFEVNDVNVEENGSRRPFPYVLPEGIKREQSVGGFQPNVLQNEASLSLEVENLPDGHSRAIYKLVNMDMRVFERMKMFLHAESFEPGIEDGDMRVFIRIGSDFEDNYYEYEIPVTFSRDTTIPTSERLLLSREVWRKENDFDISFELLRQLKLRRNDAERDDMWNINVKYVEPVDTFSGRTVAIIGNPDLGKVKGIMIGIRNQFDDGVPHSGEFWVNELRLNGLDERGGVAAIARMDVTLADFGQLTVAGSYSGIGYGSIDQKLAQRSQEEVLQYDLSANLELGKFFSEDFGLRVPFLAQYSNNRRIPRFEPLTRDIELRDALAHEDDPEERRKIKERSITATEIKSFNFNNVRKERTGTQSVPLPWNIENFTLSYSFSEKDMRTPFIESDNTKNHYGTIDYQYTLKPLYIQPFKKVFKNDKYLKFLSQFNFNPVPNSFILGTAFDRHLQVTKYRYAGDDPRYNTFYNKQFLWDRDYNVNWDISRSLKFTFNANNQAVIDELQQFDEDGNMRTDEELRNHIWQNIRDLGRTKNYQHNISLSYVLPFKHIPYLDWINVRAQYNASYNWAAAPLNAEDLGNVIQNTQKRDISGDLNFDNLYNKWKYLKGINAANTNTRRDVRGATRQGNAKPDAGGGKNNDKADEEKKKKEAGPSILEKVVIRPLLMIKNVRLRYSEDYGTIVPGFTPQSKILGMSEGFDAPGWEFIAGLQPDNAWFDRAADRANNFANPWITTDFFLNQKVQQNYTQTIDGRLTLEPFSEFKVDLDMRRRYTENHSELFKDNVPDNINRLERLLPQQFGSMEVTYFTANTLFRYDEKGIDLFRKFEENRPIISQRVGQPGTVHEEDGANYTEGFGKTQQQVLIPAFLAAYTEADPKTVNLDIFSTVPRPNWTLTYGGLSKMPWFREWFSNVNLTHGYKSTLTVNSFNTNLNYVPENPTGEANVNPQTESYYARIEIPSVVIREGFSPLFKVDFNTKNDISFGFSLDKTRDLNMNFLSNQLSETRQTQYRINFGYILQGVKFDFLTGGRKKKKKDDEPALGQPNLPGRFGRGGRGAGQPQDLTISFDFSLQDDITINHLLDRNITEATRGQRTIRISPSADYQLNRRLNIRLFVDYSRNAPKTSQSPPRTEIFGGVTVSFTLN